MATRKDFYKVLGVSEAATPEEVKKSYRALAKKFHPDVTGGDKAKESKFKEISEAYETIGDEKKRAQYDLERKSPFGGMPRGGPAGPFPGGAGRNVRVDFNDLNDLFGGREQGGGGGGGIGDMFAEFFGGGGGPRARSKGADIQTTIEVDLPVAALGGEAAVVVDGKHLNVKIPAGIEEGQAIRVAGRGAPGRSGKGDLILEVRIKPHPHFRRKEADLETDVALTVEQAVFGAKVDVPTLEGRVQLTVPPSTSSGLKLRLRGKGMPRRDGTRGDLYAVTQIHVPKDLPERAKELIAEFAKLTKK